MLHDTTEFSWQPGSAQAVWVLGKINSGRDVKGRVRQHTVCGLLMHSSLAVTREELPLGLAVIKFWTCLKFKDIAALKRSINPTCVPIEQKESMCWLDNVRHSGALFSLPEQSVHIGHRGSDIYKLFCPAQDVGTHFNFRTFIWRGIARLTDIELGFTLAGEIVGKSKVHWLLACKHRPWCFFVSLLF